ncbi:MAG: preprotein translocase subunit YajC [Candidatus Ancillula sp.]|jgi:preprotein translocase YajC subunit|nr:preprotein translocase subunit YajC [Candidatus Ancillula sp.]
MDVLLLLVVLVVFCGMIWFTQRSSRARAQEAEAFRSKISKGDVVMTGSGLIGTIETVDISKNSVVINSEGSKSRWLLDAVRELPDTVSKTAVKSAPSVKAAAVESSEDTKPSAKRAPAKSAAKKVAIKKK